MPDYSKAKIYRIISNETDKVYIGSTCDYLSSRLGKHKYSYKKGRCSTSKELLKYADCEIELIEEFPCTTKRELLDREGYHIRITPNCVNARIAGRAGKQWREDNKETIARKTKAYAQKNALNIAKYQKKYAEDHKEHLKEYHRKYHLKNKEKYNQKGKDNYQANKQAYKDRAKKNYIKNQEKLKKMVKCDCGVELQARRLREHKKTKAHLKWVDSNK